MSRQDEEKRPRRILVIEDEPFIAMGLEQVLPKLGYEVVIASGAGAESSFTDAAYEMAGAEIGDADPVEGGHAAVRTGPGGDDGIRLGGGGVGHG